MQQSPSSANPFGMMINPEGVLKAVEQSERLNGLQRRVFRPLDRPMIPVVDGAGADGSDREIDDL